MTDALDLRSLDDEGVDAAAGALRLAGLHSDPIRLYPDNWQTLIVSLRAANRGQIAVADVQPLLDAINPALLAADICLSGTVPDQLFETVVADEPEWAVTVQSRLTDLDLPPECIRYTFSDGMIVNTNGEYRHDFAGPGRVWTRCDVSIAGADWSWVIYDNLPFGWDEEPDPPADPLPSSTWLKADIVAWLLDHGVTLSESALMALTKAELLDLVTDLTDTDPV